MQEGRGLDAWYVYTPCRDIYTSYLVIARERTLARQRATWFQPQFSLMRLPLVALLLVGRPKLVERFVGAGDVPSARLVDQLCAEEVAHGTEQQLVCAAGITITHPSCCMPCAPQ